MNKIYYGEYSTFEINNDYYIGKIDRIECTNDTIHSINQYKLILNDVSPFNPKSNGLVPEIKKVIFNDPATIVYWSDGTKTVVKKQKADSKKKFDPEKGLAMAIAKKALGNTGRYFDTIKDWCE